MAGKLMRGCIVSACIAAGSVGGYFTAESVSNAVSPTEINAAREHLTATGRSYVAVALGASATCEASVLKSIEQSGDPNGSSTAHTKKLLDRMCSSSPLHSELASKASDAYRDVNNARGELAGLENRAHSGTKQKAGGVAGGAVLGAIVGGLVAVGMSESRY